MTTLNEIQQFLSPKKMAIAGVSRNPKKFGATVFKELKEKGFELYPVNPNADEVQGVKCYKSVAELPGDVKHLFIVTPKKSTETAAGDAITKGMEMIWIQQQSDTPEAVEVIKAAGIPLIHKKCILMFAAPVKGPHKFHRFLVKIVGMYPTTVSKAS